MSIASEITRINNEVASQTDLMAQIQAVLVGKGAMAADKKVAYGVVTGNGTSTQRLGDFDFKPIGCALISTHITTNDYVTAAVYMPYTDAAGNATVYSALFNIDSSYSSYRSGAAFANDEVSCVIGGGAYVFKNNYWYVVVGE